MKNLLCRIGSNSQRHRSQIATAQEPEKRKSLWGKGFSLSGLRKARAGQGLAALKGSWAGMARCKNSGLNRDGAEQQLRFIFSKSRSRPNAR
jgi:hypothetical protein